MSNQALSTERLPVRINTNLRSLPALNAAGSDAVVSLDMSQRSAMLDVIKQHASDPSIFDTREPFIWAAEISNSTVDYYFTRMDPNTTLKNFEADAIDGVAFLDSHNSMQQPLGRSFAARLVTDDASGQATLYAAFYTIPDLRNTQINTTDLIDSIRSGITKDVSVGFKRGDGYEKRCSICNGDMNRWDDCSHFEGMQYEVRDENGDVSTRTATAWIVNGRLSEVSGVYDGATSGAMIEKAKSFAQRGLLKPTMIAELERQIRMTLPHPSSTFQLGANDETLGELDRSAPTDKSKSSDADASHTDSKGETSMADETRAIALDGYQASLRSLGLIKDTETVSTVDQLINRVSTVITDLRETETRYNEFLAAETEEALAQGTRAMGDKFDQARYENLFKRATLAEIRGFKKEWEEKGDAELAGGRRSNENDDDEQRSADDAANKDKGTGKGADKKDETRAVNSFFPESLYSTGR